METNGILMPEIVLQKATESMLSVIKTDYNETVDKTKTLLYYFFNNDFNGEKIKYKTLDYYEQAVELFTTRKIQVNMGYNLEVADIPNIHILLPSEASKPMNIGADEGYREDVMENRGTDENPEFYAAPVFTIPYDANYQLIVTSPNIFEVLIIYNLLKMGFLSLHENLQFKGLQNIKMGGQDINMQTDLVPTHIFHRSFTIAFFYEMSAPRHFKEKLVKKFATTSIIN